MKYPTFTWEVCERFMRGASVKELARDFGCKERLIENALRTDVLDTAKRAMWEDDKND